MIEYFKSACNINTLLRVHGSALYKASFLGIVSALIHVAIVLQWNETSRKRADNADSDDPADDLSHPYGVGVLVTSVMFLFIFRANQGYQRYWEACTTVHHFMSKWLDATCMAGVFHLQSHHYDDIKPPCFFDNDDLNKLSLTRDRERGSESETGNDYAHVLKSNVHVDVHALKSMNQPNKKEGQWGYTKSISHPPPQKCPAVGDSFPAFGDMRGGFAARSDGRTPPLFLQELAHLSSLCCAVAMSTLRNDLDDAESPLDNYAPGSSWPAIDPNKLPPHIKKEINHESTFGKNVRFWLGADRTPKARTRYNAARPIPVLGGVSDNEIAFLQRARGKYAKVTLAWAWLQEFIVREQLAGSLGDVHTAIVSRIFQSSSDGMVYYNHARKIMYIPFPFPHAQLSAFFIAVMVPTVPFLMDQYTNTLWVGIVVSFLTTTCLAGLHEVARELENPFRNVPNEIPLCTLQAMYNEALVTMFAGYNPDHYWDPEIYRDLLDATLAAKVEVGVRDEGPRGGGGGPGVAPRSTPEPDQSRLPNNRRYLPPKISPSPPSSGDNPPIPTIADPKSSQPPPPEAVRRLREIVAKQAREIDEMVATLDEEEERHKPGAPGIPREATTAHT